MNPLNIEKLPSSENTLLATISSLDTTIALNKRKFRENEPSDGLVTLNISGTKFQCHSFIFQRFPDTLLGRMFFAEEYKSLFLNPPVDGHFFDRDPEVFRHILNWYRTGILPQPLFNTSLLDPEIVRFELKSWGIALHSMNLATLSTQNENNDQYLAEVWKETRDFFEDFIDSEIFKNVAKRQTKQYTLYFQNVQKADLNFCNYYNPIAKKWDLFYLHSEDFTLAKKIARYWTQVLYLDPLLYELYHSVFKEVNPEQRVNLFAPPDEKCLEKAISRGKKIKIAPTLTLYLYRCTSTENAGDKIVDVLPYLKQQIIRFLNNSGYHAHWGEGKVVCSEMLRVRSLGSIVTLMSDYPFVMPKGLSDMYTSAQKIVPYLHISF